MPLLLPDHISYAMYAYGRVFFARCQHFANPTHLQGFDDDTMCTSGLIGKQHVLQLWPFQCDAQMQCPHT